MNSLLAMAGGIIAAAVAGRNDPGFVHNGALAGWLLFAPARTACIRSVPWSPGSLPA